MLWRELYREATGVLASPVEARWMVEDASSGPWPAVLGTPAAGEAAHCFAAMVGRRLAGEPLQYVLGHWAFRSLDLLVDRRVLIPRPETEQVVDVAIAELDRLHTIDPIVVDLGTGSGAMALSIATERPGAQVWAVDDSLAALEVAQANLAASGATMPLSVHLAHGSWWSALPERLRGRVTLAIANPPYISTAEMAELDTVVAGWEPRRALEAGPTGLEDIADILSGAPTWLAQPGVMVIELAPHQREDAIKLAEQAGFASIEVRPDLSGRPRTLVARNPAARPLGC